jgi:hypothetical protein
MLPAQGHQPPGVARPHLAINLVNRLKRPKFINFYQLHRTKDLTPAGISTIRRISKGAFCAFCALLGGFGKPSPLESWRRKVIRGICSKNPSLPLSGDTSVLPPLHGKNFVRGHGFSRAANFPAIHGHWGMALLQFLDDRVRERTLVHLTAVSLPPMVP